MMMIYGNRLGSGNASQVLTCNTRQWSCIGQEMTALNNYVGPMPNEVQDRGKAFAELIRKARQDRQWTQDRLIEESGVSRSTLVRWENGRAERPDPDQVRALCRALGIDPRLAAVALGYLSEEDIRPPGPANALSEVIQEVLEILQDPRVSSQEKDRWIDYLKFLRDRSLSEDAHKRDAG
jgi:transcriptional regulator with XRE-family HTH domain